MYQIFYMSYILHVIRAIPLCHYNTLQEASKQRNPPTHCLISSSLIVLEAGNKISNIVQPYLMVL